MARADVGGEEGALGEYDGWGGDGGADGEDVVFGHLAERILVIDCFIFSDKDGKYIVYHVSIPRSVLVHHLPSLCLVSEIAALAGKVVFQPLLFWQVVELLHQVEHRVAISQ